MPTPEFCPNCGSFDLHVIDTYKELTWFECRTCGDEWIEDPSAEALPDEWTAAGFDNNWHAL